MNHHNQDFLKVLSWRMINIPISLLVAYLYTGNATMSLGLTLLQAAVLTSCHFLFEKIWRYLHQKQ